MATGTKLNKVLCVRRRPTSNVAKGVAHVHSTFNNTIVTISDEAGNVITWSQCWCIRFKGSRKSTPLLRSYGSEAAGKSSMVQRV